MLRLITSSLRPAARLSYVNKRFLFRRLVNPFMIEKMRKDEMKSKLLQELHETKQKDELITHDEMDEVDKLVSETYNEELKETEKFHKQKMNELKTKLMHRLHNGKLNQLSNEELDGLLEEAINAHFEQEYVPHRKN